MPAVAFGCTKAIRRPLAPVRGISSMSRYPAARQAVEGGVEIGDAVADVVDAGTTALEKLRDRTVRGERSEQLDLRLPERQRHDGRAVGLLGGMRGEAEHIPIERERRVDVGHGDSDMRNAGAISQAIPPSKLFEMVSITGE